MVLRRPRHWFCHRHGRTGRLYTIFIEAFKDEQALERLEDSRYYLSSRVEYSDVRDFYIFGTHKYVARLDLELRPDKDNKEESSKLKT